MLLIIIIIIIIIIMILLLESCVGDATVENPRRVQYFPFDLFELVLLSKLDNTQKQQFTTTKDIVIMIVIIILVVIITVNSSLSRVESGVQAAPGASRLRATPRPISVPTKILRKTEAVHHHHHHHHHQEGVVSRSFCPNSGTVSVNMINT